MSYGDIIIIYITYSLLILQYFNHFNTNNTFGLCILELFKQPPPNKITG